MSIDESGTKGRRLNIIVNDIVAPGLIDYLAPIPEGDEAHLIRGILLDWFQAQSAQGDLAQACADRIKRSKLSALLSRAGMATELPYQYRQSQSAFAPSSQVIAKPLGVSTPVEAKLVSVTKTEKMDALSALAVPSVPAFGAPTIDAPVQTTAVVSGDDDEDNVFDPENF